MANVKGLYQRGRMWWLRYTPAKGAKQERVPLNTDIESVAEVLALERLQSAPLEAADEYQIEVDRYLGEMKADEKVSSSFTSDRRYLLEAFARDMSIKSLDDIVPDVVMKWIDGLRSGKYSRKETAPAKKKKHGKETTGIKKETADTYVMRLRAFVNWLVNKRKLHANPLKEIKLKKRVKTWRKDFVPSPKVSELIKDAPDDDIRFVIFCGMHAGMRKLEIVEATPMWFQMGNGKRRGCINVGETETFSPKDRDERTIPLSTEFEEFLRGYLAKLPLNAKWVLRPDKKHGKWRYRYDFRKPFGTYMRSKKVKCTEHDMRRTFVSNKIIENGSLAPKLAKWTGDDLKTMLDHYAHLLADDDDIDVGV